MKAAEHIRYYAKLRGVDKIYVDQVIDWVLAELNLEEFRNIPSGQYSGGNKRKLSTAIAFTGAPDVILLDEPTGEFVKHALTLSCFLKVTIFSNSLIAGVDPKARRFLWEVVARMVQSGKCIILTSHAMQECEMLCGRLAIMVSGEFKCN